jgi:hypothetical protein
MTIGIPAFAPNTLQKLGTLCLLMATACAQKADLEVQHQKRDPSQQWARLIVQAAHDDGVDYTVFRDRPLAVQRYLEWASRHGQHTDWWGESKEDRRISHLANTYNAGVIYAVLTQEPAQSTDDIQVGLYRWPGAGLDRGMRFKVDGEWVNLHKLSQVDTVSRYQEPLLWLMFSDGSEDAPPLHWWPSKNLQNTLKTRMRAFLATDNGLVQTPTGWAANPLFFAREKDFLDWYDKPNLCAWMADFTDGERREWMESHLDDCPLEARPSRRGLNQAP